MTKKENAEFMAGERRARLAKALAHAVDGEMRFGVRGDVRPELDQRWFAAINLIEELCQKTPQKK